MYTHMHGLFPGNSTHFSFYWQLSALKLLAREQQQNTKTKARKSHFSTWIHIWEHPSCLELWLYSCGPAVEMWAEVMWVWPWNPGMHLPSLCHQPAACQEYIVQPESIRLPESLFWEGQKPCLSVEKWSPLLNLNVYGMWDRSWQGESIHRLKLWSSR